MECEGRWREGAIQSFQLLAALHLGPTDGALRLLPSSGSADPTQGSHAEERLVSEAAPTLSSSTLQKERTRQRCGLMFASYKFGDFIVD